MATEPTNLAAGPELDALVAEQVFNLPIGQLCSENNVNSTTDSIGFECAYHCSVCDWSVDDDSQYFLLYGQSKPHPYTARPYSTDIACAWEVVEKLRGMVSNISLHGANGWGLSLGNIKARPFSETWTKPINAPTAPHAICLAALEFVKR